MHETIQDTKWSCSTKTEDTHWTLEDNIGATGHTAPGQTQGAFKFSRSLKWIKTFVKHRTPCTL